MFAIGTIYEGPPSFLSFIASQRGATKPFMITTAINTHMPKHTDCSRQERVQGKRNIELKEKGKGIQYLIHWKCYPEAELSWENAKYVQYIVRAPELVQQFYQRFPDKPRPSKLPVTDSISGPKKESVNEGVN